MYSALTYDVMKFYLTSAWDKKIRNKYISLEIMGCYVIKIQLETRTVYVIKIQLETRVVMW